MIVENYCSIWYYKIIQSQHYNNDNNDDNDNDDNVMRVSVWFEFFGGLF